MKRGWIITCLALGCATESAPAANPSQSTGEASSTSAAETSSSSGVDGSSDGSTTGDSPPVACPQPPPQDTVDGLVHIGRGQGDSFIEILDLQARDNFVYSCTATQGLTVWDINSNPPPLVIEQIGAPGFSHPMFPRCQHLALDTDSNRAVITNRGDEIQPDPWLYLYDLSDPAAPEPLRGWASEVSIEGVVLEGERVYVAAHTAGVIVLEDQGGDALVPIGEFGDDASDAWQPLLVGDVLYVAEGNTGLRVYDVSADDPALLTTLALSGSSKDLVLDGDTLYVAAASSIFAVDVSAPSTPQIISERDAKGSALAVAVGGDDMLYVAEWDEIRVYDRSTPTLEQVWSEVVPTSDAGSRVLTLATDPDRNAVYAGEWTGMQVFEAQTDPTAPDIVAAPSTVQFGKVAAGDFADRVVVVRNEGDQPLHVYSARSDHTTVSVSEACFEVPPESSYAIEVRYDPVEEVQHRGRLILQTDDPDEPEYVLYYSGNDAKADVGDPMPEFTLQDLDGNTWSVDDLEGKVVLLAYFATF